MRANLIDLAKKLPLPLVLRMIQILDTFQQLTAGDLADERAVTIDNGTPPVFVVEHRHRNVDDVFP